MRRGDAGGEGFEDGAQFRIGDALQAHTEIHGDRAQRRGRLAWDGGGDLALADRDQHGYAIMQDVAERTNGRMRLSPGTLYGSVKRMLEQGLIVELGERIGDDVGLGASRTIVRCRAEHIKQVQDAASRGAASLTGFYSPPQEKPAAYSLIDNAAPSGLL